MNKNRLTLKPVFPQYPKEPLLWEVFDLEVNIGIGRFLNTTDAVAFIERVEPLLRKPKRQPSISLEQAERLVALAFAAGNRYTGHYRSLTPYIDCSQETPRLICSGMEGVIEEVSQDLANNGFHVFTYPEENYGEDSGPISNVVVVDILSSPKWLHKRGKE